LTFITGSIEEVIISMRYSSCLVVSVITVVGIGHNCQAADDRRAERPHVLGLSMVDMGTTGRDGWAVTYTYIQPKKEESWLPGGWGWDGILAHAGEEAVLAVEALNDAYADTGSFGLRYVYEQFAVFGGGVSWYYSVLENEGRQSPGLVVGVGVGAVVTTDEVGPNPSFANQPNYVTSGNEIDYGFSGYVRPRVMMSFGQVFLDGGLVWGVGFLKWNLGVAVNL
jgi:hypothetical protein